MKPNKDFLFIETADMNDGLTSGTVSKVAIWFTKEYFFVVPYTSDHIWGSTKTEFKNAEEFLHNLNSNMNNFSVEEFQNKCINFLPNSKIFKIENLEKFNIKTGIMFLGGIKVKKIGEQLQTINIQPKSVRVELKKFFGE